MPGMKLPLILLLLGMLPMTYGDDWPAPQIREAFSHSRAHFVRVNPGNDWADTVGFKGSVKGPAATAEFYTRQQDRSYRLTATVSLLNPVAPVDFFVTDRRSLVTLDNWHNRGYGPVVVFYTPDGKPRRSYELSDLFTRAEIERFDHSMSSISWRKPIGAYIREDQDTLYITVNDAGAYFVFEVASGAYQYCETKESKSICRTSNMQRAWKPYKEPRIGTN
jgi:hypothetical protein